jgi:DNA-directed RNA polymerase specialized sigma24 family protein
MDASDEAAVALILQTRFLAGDLTAYEEIFTRYKERMFRHIAFKANPHEKYPWKPELAEDAVAIALTDYFRGPEKFDSAKSSLLTYLRDAAYKDYLNESAKEARHQRRRERTVENEEDDWKEIVDVGLSVEELAELSAENAKAEALMREVCKTEDELILLRQVIERERDASICIAELGWPPGDESVKRLYREKDRMTKLIRRRLPRLLGDDIP